MTNIKKDSIHVEYLIENIMQPYLFRKYIKSPEVSTCDLQSFYIKYVPSGT